MSEKETPRVWQPPAEPLAVATPDNLPQVVSPLAVATAADLSRLGSIQEGAEQGATRISVGTRSFKVRGEIVCATSIETELWKEIIEGREGYVTVASDSTLHEAATRLAMIGLLAVESPGTGSPVTVRVRPDVVIEDLRENPADPYSERFVNSEPRGLAQIKSDLERQKYAVVDADTELRLPYVNWVDPTTNIRDAYAPYLKHYGHDPNANRLRVTGLIAMSSEVDLVQSLRPVIPIPGREGNVFDFVDMLNSRVLRALVQRGWYLLPDRYKQNLPLLYSINRFDTGEEIADTAHTDEGVLNGIWRLDQVSDTDGSWTYVLKPKRGRHAREGIYEERALFACKLPIGKILLLLDNEVGHTSKRATGKNPRNSTLVAALLPSIPLLT